MYDREITQLANARAEARKIADKIQEIQDEFDRQHPELAELAVQAAEADAKAKRLYEALREKIVNRLELMGEEPQHDAIGMRQYRRPKYDEADAIAYAVEHRLYTLLRLNTGAWEKVGPVLAPHSGDWEHVEMRPTISTDLSAYEGELESEEEPA